MIVLHHSIRKQTLDLEVDSETLAMALQPRLGDVNRRRFLRVIERVFDELAVPDQRIRIARLDVDLGTLPLVRFEEAAEKRLERELRRGLKEALREIAESPSADKGSQSEETSRSELLEYYLLHGTLPFWAPRGSAFSCEELFQELLESNPEGLAGIIRKHGRLRRVIERIVLQLGEPLLERLIRLLEPEHAALIIAYVVDLRDVHRVERLLALSDEQFAEAVWVLTLSYLLRDPGSQFNRKSFVRSLLEGMAAGRGLDYAEILTTLRLALERTEKKRPLRSSLPAVVSELVREARPRPATAGPGPRVAGAGPSDAAGRLELLEHYLLHGTLPSGARQGSAFSFAELFRELLEGDPERLAAIMRKHGRLRRVIERIVRELAESLLERLIQLLEPEHAALIIAYVVDLKDVHRVERLLALSDEQFAEAVWVLTLSYLLRDPGSQFNRKSFVRSLLEGMAAGRGLDYVEILTTLRLALERTEKKRPLRSSLPAVVSELVREAGPRVADVGPAQEAGRLALLEHYLLHGTLPSGAVFSFAELFRELLGCDPEGLAAIMRKHGRLRRVIERIVRELSEPLLERLIQLLEPEHAALIIAYVVNLKDGHRVEPLLALSDEQFAEVVWVLTLSYLLRDPGSQFNRKSFVRSLLEGMAAGRGLDYVEILTTLHLGLERTEKRRPLKSSLPAVVSELVHEVDPPLSGWQGQAERKVAGAAVVAPSPGALQRQGLALVVSDDHASAQGQACARSSRPGTPDSAQHAEIVSSACPCHPTASPPSSGCPGQTFGRYDQVDVLRYYLRYGVPPWSALLGDPQWTPERALAALARLPRSLLGAVFSQESPEERLGALLRAVRGLPEESLAELVVRLLPPRTGDAGGPLRSALSEFAAGAEDRPWFFAGLTAALLDRRPLDLEELASGSAPRPTSARALPDELGEWQAHELKSVLMSRLRCAAAPPAPGTADRTPAELLDALITAYPEDARQFLDALARAPGGLRDALVRACPAALLERLPQDPAAATAGSETCALRAAVFAYLLGESPAGASAAERLSDDALLQALLRMLEQSPEELDAFLRRHAADPRVRAHWVRVLPEAALVRLSAVLEPSRHRAVLDAAEVLSSAWQEIAPPGHTAAADRGELWGFLLEFLARNPGAGHSVERLVAAWFEHLAARYLAASPAASERAAAGERLLERAGALARKAGRSGLTAIFHRRRRQLLACWGPPAPRRAPDPDEDAAPPPEQPSRPPRAPRDRKPAFRPTDDDEAGDASDPIYIDNAGLVLAASFLPPLFQKLDMLEQDENGKFRLHERETASRGVHLLQHLVDGRTSAPEPLLVLNKILCGLPVGIAVAREIEPGDQELEVCEQLLRSMIANWKSIEGTSIAGLRETFLQREGRLERADDGWKLRVQRKTVDVLVDQIPWSISVVYHRWMPEPLRVTW